MAHICKAVIDADQAMRQISGHQRSLELALNGYIVPELEWNILNMSRAL